MSPSTAPQGSQAEVPGTVTLDAICAAANGPALDKLAKMIGVTFPTNMTGIEAKRGYLVKHAHTSCMLHESQCAKVVQENPELQDKVLALQLAVQDAQRVAAAAAATADEAAAAAAAAQETAAAVREENVALRVQVAKLNNMMEEAADAPAQKVLEGEAIWFGHTLGEGELQQGGDELRNTVCAALLAAGLPEGEVAAVREVTVLPSRGGDKRAPVVLRCTSAAAKGALLRAARAAGKPGAGLQMAARLTRWQQMRKKELLPLLHQLKSNGAAVRFTRGHVLQKQVEGRWVDVPPPHTA
jgi:hypothetical protein